MTDTRIIQLTRGFETVVNTEDYYWLTRYKWFYNGKINKGYAGCHVEVKKKATMHRLILEYYGHDLTNLQVDHINHDKLDNRKENLRVATHADNGRNKKIQNNNTSGFRNVYWRKQTNKWIAKITIKSSNRIIPIYGGGFDNREEAAIKANELMIEYFGEFAQLNIIPE